MGEFNEFYDLIKTSTVEKIEVSTRKRLARILEKGLKTGVLSKHFLPVLRQTLLTKKIENQFENYLDLSTDRLLPSDQELEEHNFYVVERNSKFRKIRAEPWCVNWVNPKTSNDVFSHAYIESKVLKYNDEVDADNFYKDCTKFSSYKNQGQRQAIISTLLAPEGSTLFVNLPTGSGKSMVGQLPTFMYQQDGKIIIFVVPTISLAKDQERRFKEAFPDHSKPIVWDGSTTGETREEIKKNLLNGKQKLLISSPESLCGSLKETLIETNKKKYLSHLVIDEAHMIFEWGDSFRPDFQNLICLRNSLLRQRKEAGDAGFRTIFLSATLTEYTIDSISSFLEPKEDIKVFSAPYLRPEAKYWFFRCRSESDKNEKVLQLIKYSPRPFLLYVNTPEEADNWKRDLISYGYDNVETFTGKTNDKKRGEIIRKWAKDELDVVIGNSAFGLGIDKDNVRAVIHVGIPGTLDRFYQEVGRGGRDGRPFISALVYVEDDWNDAITKTKLIGSELGFKRWQTMYQNRTPKTEGTTYYVDIGTVRHGLRVESGSNELWNLSTLMLMVRAGIISLIDSSEFEHDSLENFGYDENKILITEKELGHLDENTWARSAEIIRRKHDREARKNTKLFKSVLNGSKSICNGLAELYKIKQPVLSLVRQYCGGCYLHQDVDLPIPFRAPSISTNCQMYTRVNKSILESIFGYPYDFSKPLFLTYSEKSYPENILLILRWLVSECNIIKVRLPYEFYEDNIIKNLYKVAKMGFVIEEKIENNLLEWEGNFGDVSVFPPREKFDKNFFEKFDDLRHRKSPTDEEICNIMIIPETLPQDLINDHRLFKNVYETHSLEHILGIIQK